MPYFSLGEKSEGLLSKAYKHIGYICKVVAYLKEHNIGLAIGSSGIAVHAAKLAGVHSILFDDDDQSVQPLTAKLISPFAGLIVSPDCLAYECLPKALYYPGYQELAYLHPQRFFPDPMVLERNNLDKSELYFVLRFNAFKAHHDVREGGMSVSQKRALIKMLEREGRVFITTESKLAPEFERFKLPIKPHEMHSFLYYSAMLISDSQTMTSEAAVLGVPSFRFNTFVGRISYLEEEEKRYGLTKGFLPHQFQWMLDNVQQTLRTNRDSTYWREKSDLMINDKIDVTAFWLWLIDNYPDSFRILENNGINYDQFR
jgi:predicted glycosyltransferase